ncbi:hypothetical protein, partial [Mesorhizobium sp. M5C.F.Ca.IN.020.29.1.1]|uniref:hypothetical protein n=1 Tax=Mesorhizobium sp. M5C.F.Ca.IN.020.29.1.1 TaxID=2496770 RepID=UPI0019D1D711
MSGEKVYATVSFLQQRIQTPGNRRRALPNWQRMTRPDVGHKRVRETEGALARQMVFRAGDLKISRRSAVQ